VFLGLGTGAVFKLVPEWFPTEVGAVTGVVGAAGGLGGFFPPLVMGLVKSITGGYALGFVLLAVVAGAICVVGFVGLVYRRITNTRVRRTTSRTDLVVYFLLVVLIGVIVVNLRLQDSRIGRAWEAIREDELAARSMGINTRNMKLLAFAMGASFGGVAGGMFAAMQNFISPESFVLTQSVMVLSMVVLGGMGNIWGVILGAVLLTFVPEILRYTVEPVERMLFGRAMDPEVIRMLLFGLAMVVMMLFRPAGILPSAVRKRELAAPEDEL
jgi:ABC-type branched-subunit amino acid transport system permease subunit